MTAKPKSGNLVNRLRARLNHGRSWLTRDIGELLPGRNVDEALLETIEESLLTADVGIEASNEIVNTLRQRARQGRLQDVQGLRATLRTILAELLTPAAQPLVINTGRPFVLLVVGVNGVGKTTTIGKLAARIKNDGYEVMLAAGDTFRAAAIEQLQVWGERTGIPVFAQAHGADPAAVIYDAMQSARSRNTDVLIADTAGRLHTQAGLMDELKKIRRVIAKVDATAPHEVLLVVDATSGQNVLNQIAQFHDAVGVTGLVITKLDGTAKGGILFAATQRFGIPIRFIGIGETLEDLVPFEADAFAAALVDEDVVVAQSEDDS